MNLVLIIISILVAIGIPVASKGVGMNIIPTPTPVFLGIEPKTISIHKLNVVANIEAVGLADNQRMATPRSIDNAAWYSLGYKPGELGSSVIAGHFDTPFGTPGIFNNLDSLSPGDIIEISGTDGRVVRFMVENVQSFSDEEFPIDIVFSQSDQPRLNLITCDGVFDTSSKNYLRRLVVFAVFLP